MRTIKSKLLLVYLLFTCITLSSSFYCYTIYRVREQNAEVKDLIHLISSEILFLNKLEMQFVVYDSKNNSFFESAGSRYVQKHEQLVIEVNKRLRALDQQKIPNEKIAKNLRELKAQLISYNNDYRMFVSKIKDRGFRDLGIEGKMRASIHSIENSYQKNKDESLLLTIRRNEKDYFLRKDSIYIDKHKSNVALFRTQIEADKQLTAAEKKQYIEWLDQYMVLFTMWAKIDGEIGIDQGTGLTLKMKNHNIQFEKILREINTESDRSDAVLSNNNKGVLLTAIAVSAILSIVLSILFSYVFTKPIKELSDYINLIVKNNFSVPTKNIQTDSNDEISELFDNLNWMVNRVEIYVDEIKKNELLVEASEKKFRSLIENSNDAIALTDETGKIVYASSSTMNVLGYTSEEVESKIVFEDIHPEDIHKFKNHRQDVLQDTGLSKHVELRVKHKDGTYRWLECHSCNMLGDVTIHAVITNYRDITNRKTSEFKIENQYAELQKVNAELDGFVYSASHDLKAPLLSILGIINIAKVDAKEDVAVFYFNMIETSINKLIHVIKDIINFSRNTHLEVEKEPVDLNQIIQESIQALSYLENKGKVTFDIDVSRINNFYSDKARLGMIFSNMISNAIIYHNYEQENPVIQIAASFTESNEIEIEILDNGQGIDPLYQARIFDMFYRASTDSKGSGLGLYIVKNIVDKMHGSIELSSVPGVGTTFKIVFPNNSIQEHVESSQIKTASLDYSDAR